MAGNGSSNGVAFRDECGRYLKGVPGGPGRPVGSRNKLSEDFLGDIHAAWLERGGEVLDRLIAEQPEVFFLAMVKIAQVHRVELGKPSEFDRPRTREQILQRMEERTGQQGRRLLEKFFKQVEKLEAEQDRADGPL